MADPPHLDLQREEVELRVGDLVQPVESRTMLLGEPFGDPHNGHGVKSCRIRQQLAQVTMVRPFKLVFDEDPVFGIRILAENVRSEGTDLALRGLYLELDADRVAEKLYVVFRRQPWRELARLIGPNRAKGDSFQPTQLRHDAHRRSRPSAKSITERT